MCVYDLIQLPACIGEYVDIVSNDYVHIVFYNNVTLSFSLHHLYHFHYFAFQMILYIDIVSEDLSHRYFELYKWKQIT